MTVAGGQLTEQTDDWMLPLVGREVDQVRMDFAVTLVVDGSETVRLATPFTVQADGATRSVDPQQPESVLPVLALHRAVIVGASAGKNGTLQLQFDGNRVLQCQPDGDEEAWEVGGGLPPVTPAYRIAAKPGGGVVVT